MENATQSHTHYDSKYPRWLIWALAAVVSGDELLRILVGWRAYDMLTRFDAVALIFLLLVFPIRLALDFHKGKRMEIEQAMVFAYTALMMATILASH
jgi:hypothetical protein